jgi:hypothetical protein
VNQRTAPPRRGRRSKIVAIVLTALGLLVLLAYPVVANALLAFGGVQMAFEGTDQVAVDFRRAWTFWPGRVHVEDARVTMQDRNVQFALQIARADVTVDLLAFTRRTFHATKVRGSGVSFRFRHRIEHEALGLPFVAALPPIPEFHDPPLREFGPPPAPLDEEHYNLWTVHIEDVDVIVNELWTQMMRYEGEARVVGAFRLRPAKRLWVGPADLTFRGGSLTSGPYEVLDDMRGKLTCKVDDFDVEPVHGMEPFRFISTHLRLAASVASLNVVNFLSEPSPAVVFEDGSGLLDIDVATDHGVFTPKSRLSYRTAHVGVQNDKLPFRLDGEVELLATGPRFAPGGHLLLAIPSAALVVATSKRQPPVLRDVEIELGTSNLDVTRDFPLVRSEARAGDIVLPDLAWISDLPFGHPRKWKIEKGHGHVGGVAVLRQPSQAIDASLSAGFGDAAVTTEAFRASGAADFLVTAHVSAAGGATLKGRLMSEELEIASEAATASMLGRAVVDADFGLSSRGIATGRIQAETSEWITDVGSSRFSGSTLTGSAQFEPTSITASATVTGIRTSALGSCPWAEAEQATIAARVDTPEDGDPHGDVLATLGRASLRWGEFEAHAGNTSLLGRWSKTLFSAKLDANKLAMKNAGGAPRGWQADVGSIAATADFSLGDKRAQGPAHIDVRNAMAQVGKTRVRGDMTANLTVSAPNEALGTADVSGRMQVRDVSLATKENTLEGWWANFDFDRARLDTRQDFNLTGKVKARFRDGLPALYILASEDEIPSFMPNLVPLEGLSVDLGVERFCRWTDVQILDARGGPFAAEGRLQVEPGETRGALLLRLAALKPISLGLHFVEDYSDAAPFVGGGWLEKHLAPLTTAATQKHDQRCIPQPPKCQ